jgi:hypothetical protein
MMFAEQRTTYATSTGATGAAHTLSHAYDIDMVDGLLIFALLLLVIYSKRATILFLNYPCRHSDFLHPRRCINYQVPDFSKKDINIFLTKHRVLGSSIIESPELRNVYDDLHVISEFSAASASACVIILCC